MSRKIIFLLITFLHALAIFSQQINPPPVKIIFTPNPAPRTPANGIIERAVLDPSSGMTYVNSYFDDVKGSPFFIERWQYALIKLRDGRTYDPVNVLVDINKQQLNFKTWDNIEMFFSASLIKEIDIYDSLQSRNIIYKFKTGFPKIDKQTENSFYQVLAGDSILLLKSIIKHISTNKNDLSGEVEKKFETYEDYYTFFNGEIKRLKKNKEYILDLLSKQKTRIESFVSDNKLSFKNEKDLIKIFDYYNSQ